MYLNQDFGRSMGGSRPLRYVDVDDEELSEFPVLAAAVEEGRRLPLVLVGDEIVTPPAISVFWIEDQLDKLGALVSAGEGGQD